MPLNREQLQARLIDFGANACTIIRGVPRDLAGAHVAKQVVRCATSPAANYAEACSAESRNDFIHKMQICLKEIRETRVWLALIRKLWPRTPQVDALLGEGTELMAIFVASIHTSRRRNHDE